MNRKTIVAASLIAAVIAASWGFNASVQAAADVYKDICPEGGTIVITNNKNGNAVMVCKAQIENPLGRAVVGKFPCNLGESEGTGHITISASGNLTLVCAAHK
jgi:hypothetical protein